MTSATGSFLGFAKQTAKGAPNTTYIYMPFSQATGSPQNLNLPLDMEAGGGALLRDVIKAGVSSAGAMEFIPRPTPLLTLLTLALGQDVSATQVNGAAYKHIVKMNTDQFDIPYATIAPAPANLWGEQFEDCRVSALGLSWRAPGFVRATMAYIGGKASKTVVPVGPVVDTGAPFITPTASIEVPTGTALKVLSGSFTIGNAIPMDEQWIVGSYNPDGFDVVSRAIAVQLAVKITDAELYSKMMYDPAGGSAWVASLFREGKFKLQFKTEKTIGATGLPYQMDFNVDAGNKQVETATAAGACTGTGVATAIVTASGMTNSPKTVSVAVTSGDSVNVWANKFRAALGADPDVSAFFNVSGSADKIVLTAKAAAANDGTMNIALATGTATGITAAPTSANTVAGTVGSAVDNFVWTAEPIGLRAGRNVIMAITGTLLAVSSGDPITVELVNDITTPV